MVSFDNDKINILLINIYIIKYSLNLVLILYIFW
jgi:hypothetical protein